MREEAAFIALALIGLAWLGVEMFIPSYVTSPWKTRERIRQQDLFVMNQILSQYTLDRHRYPQSLDDLVAAGYLKQMPTDPMTEKKRHMGFAVVRRPEDARHHNHPLFGPIEVADLA